MSKESRKWRQKPMRIGMQNLNKKPYNLSFSPKNRMYVILGTLLSSLVSTSTVKTRKVESGN